MHLELHVLATEMGMVKVPELACFLIVFAVTPSLFLHVVLILFSRSESVNLFWIET